MTHRNTLFSLACLILLNACGGGSSSEPSNGGSSEQTPTPFIPPSTSVEATPEPTPTPTSAVVIMPTSQTSPTPGASSTPTATPSPSETPSIEPSVTPTPTPTSTPITTQTPTSTPTSTPSVSTTPTPTVDPEPPVASPFLPTISGTVTYDFVPHLNFGALDYNNIESRPVRGVKVELLSSNDSVLQTTRTNSSGIYAFEVDENIDVKIRVWAQLLLGTTVANTSSNVITVTDNTSQNAAYVMEGNVSSSGIESSTRDFHASSGWGGSSYTSTRVAAPFAIADSVYEAAMLLRDADANLDFQNVELRWSINNTPVSGSLTAGQIGTSFYNGEAIYLLGDENNDTEEFDRSVVQHEFGHYVEDTMSRSDSIGGSHSLSTLIDMRVSFSEGFANAFTAIASNTGYYEDSYSTQQSGGFRFSLEDAAFGTQGYFAEKSAGGIIYDIADDNSDAGDSLSLGFAPIYNALSSNEYKNNNALTSIYLFADVIKSQLSAQEAQGVDDILENTQIFGTGVFGESETYDGGVDNILPVYHTLTAGNSVNVCVNNSTGDYNGVDVRSFIVVTIPSSTTYQISASRTSGSGTRDPDIVVTQNGNFEEVFESSVANTETGSMSLTAGEYIFEFYDYNNVSGQGGGLACFDISVAAL